MSFPSRPSGSFGSRAARRLGAALLTAAGLAGTTACADLGDRADTGDCPLFGDCSPDTPQCLAFASAGFGGLGGGIVPVAIGGRLDLRLTDVATGQPLSRPYRASTRGALAVIEQRQHVVSLRGVSPESDTLRIEDASVDASGEALFDQIGVLALPATSAAGQPGLLFDLGLALIPQARDRAIALHAGSSAPVTFQLLTADRVRVVDEDLAIATAPTTTAAATLTRGSSWDLATIATTGAGPLDLELSAAGQIFPLQLPVVAEVEAIEAASSATPVRVGDSAFVCFNATAAGRNVLGVPWTFTAAGATGERFLDTGCFSTAPLATAGPISVTASSGSRTLTFTLEVLPKARSNAAQTTPPAAHTELRRALEAATAAAPSSPSGAPGSLGDRAAYSSSPVQ